MGFWLLQYSYILISLLAICYVTVVVAKASCLQNEKLALLQFNQSFTLDCHAPYAQPTTLSWSDDRDCCSWDGVKCSKKTGNVIGLDLSSSCLYGSLSPHSSLFRLSHLKELNLSHNDFIGSLIPSHIGRHLKKLKSLDLSYSRFSGQVPSDICKLSRLSLLDLSYNFGLELNAFSLERLVRNLTHLNVLVLDSVDISSPVPNIFANLTSLKSLSLRYCYLYGEFPTNIFHLPHLQDLDLTGNVDLVGSLPEFDQGMPLRTLDLSYTSFSGDLPSSIGNLVHMEKLRSSSSKLSGHVPFSLGNLTKLTALELGQNFFTGDLPSSVANLTQLRSLALSGFNATHDELFPWLSKLNNLISLDLQGMNLVGEIPSVLKNFTSLTYLNLNGNYLTGHIPHWLMNLTHLQGLGLSDNRLEGSLSPMISQLEYLQGLYLDGNDNLHVNFDTLLNLEYLGDVQLDGLPLTFNYNTTTNASTAKFTFLSLDGCNLTEFPSFLHSQDKLQVLQLKGNRIQGVIPQWLVNVTRGSLLLLDLSLNPLTGFEQPTDVLPWDNLEIFYLEGSKIQGSLPIPSNSMLIYHISDSFLTGDIPSEICHAKALNYLDLSFNKLGGRIPKCISQLVSSLEILNLQGNDFHGTIPHTYPKSCKLKMINLSQNRLAGNMPRSLANCMMLEILDIGSNQINDTFPSWMGILPNLQILILGHNNFHSRIGRPNATFDFPSLRIIDLSHNFHTGNLPSHYFKKWDAMKVVTEEQSGSSGTSITFMLRTPPPLYLFPSIDYSYTISITYKRNDIFLQRILTALRVIDFSSNNFSGRIPDFIGELKGLQAINLSNNNLDGGIPMSVASIRDLESLDLSRNKLSGEIPQQLLQLTFLEVFNVSHNILVGPIPEGNQFSTFDNSSFDGNLGLCGGTLSKKCGNSNEPPPLASVTESEKDDHVIDWIIKSLGCLSGFVIGCVIGKYMTDKNHDWFVETFTRRRRPRARSK